MRPSLILTAAVAAVLLFDLCFYVGLQERRLLRYDEVRLMQQIVEVLGISDLAIATEARYTRHPAASDGVVPFMDHPGSIEHFPTGSFWRPVR